MVANSITDDLPAENRALRSALNSNFKIIKEDLETLLDIKETIQSNIDSQFGDQDQEINEKLNAQLNQLTARINRIVMGTDEEAIRVVMKNIADNAIVPNSDQRKPLSDKIGVHAWGWAFQQDNLNNNGAGFKLIKEHGFKFVRMGISWASSEPTVAGVYSFGITNQLVNQAVAAGLTPIVFVSPDTPKIYADDSYVDNLPRFLKFYQAAVSGLSGQSIYWEGLNEPNGSVSWFKSATDTDDFQTKLASVTHKMALLAKRLDVSGHFIAGVVASNTWDSGKNPWQDFTRQALAKKIDA